MIQPRTTATMTDLVHTINGFDEVSIATQFGTPWAEMARKGADKIRFIRALIFVDQRRQGAKDRPAFRTAMEIPTVEVPSYFPADEAEGGDGADPEG